MTESRVPTETHPPQMEPLARLPVFLSLTGKRALVAGGTAAAAWKAELLSAHVLPILRTARSCCIGAHGGPKT